MTEKTTTYFNRNGVRRTIVTDSEDRSKFSVLGEQNIDEIARGIERDRELHKPRSANKLAARIPTVVYDDLVARGIAGDDERFRIWLNSDEAKPYRIWQGVI